MGANLFVPLEQLLALEERQMAAWWAPGTRGRLAGAEGLPTGPRGAASSRDGGGSGRLIAPAKRRAAITEAFAGRLSAWYPTSVVEGGADVAGNVWPGRDGRLMDEHTPTQAASRALVRAGLVDDAGRPLVALHGLRHSCGSILLARSVPLIVISRHLGHADPDVTAKVYAHLLNDARSTRPRASSTSSTSTRTLQ